MLLPNGLHVERPRRKRAVFHPRKEFFSGKLARGVRVDPDGGVLRLKCCCGEVPYRANALCLNIDAALGEVCPRKPETLAIAEALVRPVVAGAVGGFFTSRLKQQAGKHKKGCITEGKQ